MQHADDQNDDPLLRQALCRAAGAERAPESLRRRIEARLQAEHRLRWRRPLYGLAAAAVVLIGVGIAFYLIQVREHPAPNWFAAAMVRSHDQCAALPDHHLLDGGSPQEWSAIRGNLHEQLGFPVMAAPLGDGWQFAGAGICEVSGVKSAHLLFRRGDEAVSVFSVPGALLHYNQPVADGTSYSQVEQDHPVSGFIWGGAVHCLVGSSKSGRLTLSDLRSLRDHLRPLISATHTSASLGVCAPR